MLNNKSVINPLIKNSEEVVNTSVRMEVISVTPKSDFV